MIYGMVLTIIAGGIGVALIAYVVMLELTARAARKRFQSGENREVAAGSLIDTVLKPIFSSYAPLFKRVGLKGVRGRLEKKFGYAAITHYTPEEFWAFQVFASALFMLFLAILNLELQMLDFSRQIPTWAYAAAALCGFFFPCLWLNSLIRIRHEKIRMEFAPFVTNLTLTAEAGLDFISAVTRIVRGMTASPLREELGRMLSEIQLGSSRAAALRNLSNRAGIQEISTFALVLVQADRFGTSIGQVLRAQASRLRRERFEAAERKGAMAAQKLLFPLIFFIMPAVFIVVFGPIIVRVLTEGFGGLFL